MITLTRCAEQSDSEAEGQWERGSEKLVSDRTVLVWGDEMLGANGCLTVCMYLLPLNHTHHRGAKMLTFVLCTLFHTDRKRQLCSVSGKEHREDNLLYGTGPFYSFKRECVWVSMCGCLRVQSLGRPEPFTLLELGPQAILSCLRQALGWNLGPREERHS